MASKPVPEGTIRNNFQLLKKVDKKHYLCKCLLCFKEITIKIIAFSRWKDCGCTTTRRNYSKLIIGEIRHNLKLVGKSNGILQCLCLICNKIKDYSNKGYFGKLKSCGCTQKKLLLQPGDVKNNLKILEKISQTEYKYLCLICNKEFISCKKIFVSKYKSCGCLKSRINKNAHNWTGYQEITGIFWNGLNRMRRKET